MIEINLNEVRPHNKRLAQWRVTWLIEHSTSHPLLWCIDSFMLRNPPLRQAPNRSLQAEKPTAQTAHLVFANAKANAEKTKRAVSSPRSKKEMLKKIS